MRRLLLLHLNNGGGPRRLLPRARTRFLVGELDGFRPLWPDASLFNKSPRLGIAA
jgi:hypothetical protein